MTDNVRDLLNVAMFIGASVMFAVQDMRELASACLGCAITLVTPRNTKVPPAVIGAAAGLVIYSVI